MLVLSVHENPIFTERALEAGALGYVSKRAVPEVLVEAVRAVAAGRQFLEREIAQSLALARTLTEPVHTLTDREFDVFRLLAGGKTVNDIAALLHISPKTAGTHQTTIYRKLGGVKRRPAHAACLEPEHRPRLRPVPYKQDAKTRPRTAFLTFCSWIRKIPRPV